MTLVVAVPGRNDSSRYYQTIFTLNGAPEGGMLTDLKFFQSNRLKQLKTSGLIRPLPQVRYARPSG